MLTSARRTVWRQEWATSISPRSWALREAGYDGCVSVEAYQHPDSETAMRVSAETLLPLLDEPGPDHG